MNESYECESSSVMNNWYIQYVTYQLQLGDMFLPPDILLVLGLHQHHLVVAVHDGVHQTVYCTKEHSVAACNQNSWSSGCQTQGDSLTVQFYFEKSLMFATQCAAYKRQFFQSHRLFDKVTTYYLFTHRLGIHF